MLVDDNSVVDRRTELAADRLLLGSITLSCSIPVNQSIYTGMMNENGEISKCCLCSSLVNTLFTLILDEMCLYVTSKTAYSPQNTEL